MLWDELHLDDEQPAWVIGRTRTKNGTAHVVPLTPAVVAILRAVPRIEGSPFVFSTNGRTAVSGFSRAKADLDRRMGIAACGVAIAPWRFHDLRRTAASTMARLGQPVHVVEAVLNHRSGTLSGVAGVYNLYAYASEKQAALVALADFVLQTAGESEATNVVALGARR